MTESTDPTTTADDRILIEIDGPVARVRLHRPEKRNAFDDGMARALDRAFQSLEDESDLRVVVLEGSGSVFCAGGDLEWMRRVATYTHAENLEDAAAFQRAFERIDRFPLPVIGRVQGAALGSGAGLVAVCDIAVAAVDAKLGFPEVRLGLVPGVISPFVVRKIGASHARHLFLTGERFDGVEAQRIGLVHVAVPEKDLDAEVALVIERLLRVAPDGARRCKQLVHDLLDDPREAAMIARQAIAKARASADGREGTTAFLEKRKPGWIQ